MIQNYDGIAISQFGKYSVRKKIAKNVDQRLSQQLTIFGNTPSNNTSA